MVLQSLGDMDLSRLSSLSNLSGVSAVGSTQDPTYQPSQGNYSGECWLDKREKIIIPIIAIFQQSPMTIFKLISTSSPHRGSRTPWRWS